MKKQIISTLACATAMAISTLSYGATGKVNTDTARVRSEASSNSSIVDLLSEDDKVEVIEEQGDWYKIKKENTTGYVSKSLLNIEGTVEKTEEKETTEATEINETKEEKTAENTVTNETSTETAVKTEIDESKTNNVKEEKSILKEAYTGKISSEVTIKILPSINSTDIAKVEKDTQINIIEILNDWCHIETDKYTGWARVKIVENAITAEATSEEVAENVEEEKEPEEPQTQSKVGYVNVESVNLRKEANTSSEKLDSITKNTEVTILGEENGWYKVKIKEQTGYISKEYISDKKVDEVSSRASDTARQIMEAKETEEPTAQESATKKTSSTSGTGNDVVAFAKQYLGYNYVSGGKNPSSGFDCSGFTSYVYKNFGVSLSGSSTGQVNAGTHISKSELEPGDLLIFNNSSNSSVGHVGIYIGDDQFIHAANASKGVITTSLSSSYYDARYVDARRVID